MFESPTMSEVRRLQVVRLRAGSRAEIVVCSPKFFSLTTHWVGFTVPCCVTDCALCQCFPARGLFYLACRCESRPSMLELSPASAGAFEQACKLFGGGMTPGVVVEVWRSSAKGGVRSEFVRRIDGMDECDFFRFVQAVMALYSFPVAQVSESIDDYERRCRTIASVRNRRLAEEHARKRDRRA